MASIQVEYLAKKFLETDQFRVSSDGEIREAINIAINKAQQETKRRWKEIWKELK